MLQYIAITTDDLELPVASADSPGKLAKLIGMKPQTISSAICKKQSNGRYRGFNIIVVEIEDYHDPLGDIPCHKWGAGNRKRWKKEEKK